MDLIIWWGDKLFLHFVIADINNRWIRQQYVIDDNTWLCGDMKIILKSSFDISWESTANKWDTDLNTREISYLQYISDDSRWLPRKIRKCFDLILLHFGSCGIETWQTRQEREELNILTTDLISLTCEDMIFWSKRNPGNNSISWITFS